MTFRCEHCRVVSEHGEDAVRVVVKTRVAIHPFRGKANRDYSDDPGGTGTQIVKELLVRQACVPHVRGPE